MKIMKSICLIGFVLAVGLWTSRAMCQEKNADLIKSLKLIESKMADINTLSSKFVQEKNLALFKQKIEIKGALYLKKPSSFVWHIDSPLKQRIVLENNIFKQWDEDTNQVQKMNLSKNPSFSVITDQMQRWVSGSYLSMMDEYQIEILQTAPIGLKFTPLENSMSFKMIQNIEIFFQVDETYIDTINILETNGDTTQFKFIETVLNGDLDPGVWKVRASD